MNRAAVAIGAAGLCCTLILVRSLAPNDAQRPTQQPAIAALLALDPGSAEFARAIAPRRFEFPRDHGPHEDFQTEWWYFSGHLSDDEGNPFGFQLTLFRFRNGAQLAASESAWRTPTLLLGHFAITDVAGAEFHHHERMSRAVPGIAGVNTVPLRVWIDDWSIAHERDSGHWRLRAVHGRTALELELVPTRDVVLHGDGGLSQKGADAGNASYYYSIPRLAARGTLRLAARRIAVAGTAWLDREWSTSSLEAEQEGWDWFAFQLSDGSELMFYRLRALRGKTDPHSAGMLLTATGDYLPLTAQQVEVEPLRFWRSPHTRVRYPSRWHFALPEHGITLTVTPRVEAQEWTHRFRYWEGTVEIEGTVAQQPLTGLGFVELTGYR